jgi:hypothetical protein
MTFDPTQFGFVQLRDFRIAESVPVYEYKNHPAVDGTKDFLRLNLYLTVDGSYVTIWHGLLEPLFAEAEFAEGRLASVARPANMDSSTRITKICSEAISIPQRPPSTSSKLCASVIATLFRQY